MKAELGAEDTVPFHINIAGESIVDDDTLSVPVLLQKMKACTERMTSSCPSPYDFKQAFVNAGKSFAVTISSKLSGSFSSALIGAQMAREEGAETHVFDSQSAVCGEVLIAYKIRELLNNGEPRGTVIETITRFIDDMKTLFVLDDVSNLVKNGRMSKIAGALVSMLGIKPLLGAKDGEIELCGKVWRDQSVADRLLDAIAECGRVIDGDDLVIAHCNNPTLAEELLEKAKRRFRFGKTRIIETRGLSSFYACDKGVVLSF
jgi:DegV family protein with EDD domain